MIQGTQEWLQWRGLGIGGSDAPIIMGASPWKTALQLWNEKVTGQSVDISSLPHVQRGHDLEDKGREFAEHLLCETYLPTCLVHSKYDQIRASFDGLSLDRQSAIEIKCPGRADHASAVNGKIPDKYIWQLRHLMLVADLVDIYYVSFDGEKGVILKLDRCLLEEKKLIEAELLFWKSVKSRVPPDYSCRDFVPMIGNDWEQTAKDYLEIARGIKDLEETRDELKRRLVELAGTHQRVAGSGLQLSQRTRVGGIDYAKIPQLKDVDLNSYRKKGSTFVVIQEVDGES